MQCLFFRHFGVSCREAGKPQGALGKNQTDLFWVQNPAPPLIDCVILDKWLNLDKPQFLHLLSDSGHLPTHLQG